MKKERSLQNHYDTELSIFTPFRHQLALAQPNRLISSASVSALAEKFYPDVFDQNSVILPPDLLARKFKDTNSISQEINGLEPFLDVHPDIELVKVRLEQLRKTKEIIQSGGSADLLAWSPIDDVPDLPGFSSDAEYRGFALNNDRYLRVFTKRIDSPDHREDGGTLSLFDDFSGIGINKEARMAITYYRTWQSGEFDLIPEKSSGGKLALRDFLGQFREQLCDLCQGRLQPRGQKMPKTYRLPHCFLFVRFYDEVEQI